MSDINITVTDREGVSHQLNAPTDMNMNLMEVCRSYDILLKGFVVAWQCAHLVKCMYTLNSILGERNDDEEAMLDEAYHVKSNSRLGCQISISTELEGARFELAPQEP